MHNSDNDENSNLIEDVDFAVKIDKNNFQNVLNLETNNNELADGFFPNYNEIEMNEIGDIEEGTDKSVQNSANNTDRCNSLPDNLSDDSNREIIFVKFYLLLDGKSASMNCLPTDSILMIKQQFSVECSLPVNNIQVWHQGNKLSNWTTLENLGFNSGDSIQFELDSSDPINFPLRRNKKMKNTSDVIIVKIPLDNDGNEFKEISVEINRKNVLKKPFLGGFRNKLTGLVFHHAAMQTIPKPKIIDVEKLRCRDTQTYMVNHAAQQVVLTTSTQMSTSDIYMPRDSDKILQSNKYLTADERHSIIVNKVILMQKYLRRWLARRRVRDIKKAYMRKVEWDAEQEELRQQQKEQMLRQEYERRMNPKTKQDFQLAYSALEEWRVEEESKINATLCGAERKAALCLLLDKQAQLLANIDRQKSNADLFRREKTIGDFIKKTSSPKTFKRKNGEVISMATPYTIKAGKLGEIYKNVSVLNCAGELEEDIANFYESRLQALNDVKQTIKEHDCSLTKEINSLIDRELDLIDHKMRDSNLEGLRRRISQLFYQYIRTPAFNPEAANAIKIYKDQTMPEIFYCASCSKYLPAADFQVGSASKSAPRCRKCLHRSNIACDRTDVSHHRKILKSVRKAASVKSPIEENCIAFLVQENDIGYLVDKIWGAESLLSGCKDKYELVLISWDSKEPWSPWNCILLTREEAKIHSSLGDFKTSYGEEFLRRVVHKHTLARNHFGKLPKLAQHLNYILQEEVN